MPLLYSQQHSNMLYFPQKVTPSLILHLSPSKQKPCDSSSQLCKIVDTHFTSCIPWPLTPLQRLFLLDHSGETNLSNKPRNSFCKIHTSLVRYNLYQHLGSIWHFILLKTCPLIGFLNNILSLLIAFALVIYSKYTLLAVSTIFYFKIFILSKTCSESFLFMIYYNIIM